MPLDTKHSQDITTSLAYEYLGNVFCAIFKEKVVIVEDPHFISMQAAVCIRLSIWLEMAFSINNAWFYQLGMSPIWYHGLIRQTP